MISINYSQNSQRENVTHGKSCIDSIVDIHLNLRDKMYKNEPNSYKNQLLKLLNSANKCLDTNNQYVKYVKGFIMYDLQGIYRRESKLDSVRHYLDYILTNIENKPLLARASKSRAKLSLKTFDYENYLTFINKSIEFAEAAEDINLKQSSLISLGKFYSSTRQFDMLEAIQRELHNSIDSTSIENKVRISINDYYLLNNKGKFREALSVLTQFQDSITSNFSFRGYYYFTVSDAYLNLKKYDSSLYFIEKNKHAIKDSYSFYNKLATIYYHKKDFNAALTNLNKVPNPLSKYNLHRLGIFLSNASKIHQALGNDSLAITYLNDYIEEYKIQEKKVAEKKVAIFNYELKKNAKINKLKAEKELQKVIISNNKKAYNFQLFIGSLTIIIIFSILLYRYKRRQEKKRLILEKNSEINKLKTQYIENITHEFKTPVSVNIGYLDLIKTNTLKPKKIADYIDISLGINNKLLTTLEDLLTFIKLDNTEILLKDHLTDQNVFSFLHTEIQKFEYSCSLKGLKIKLITNVKPEYQLLFDYSKLNKVLNNLLTNAIKFSKVERTIYVTFLVHENHIMIQVKDEGIGIDKTLHTEIFKRFYQAKQNEGNGFGIGLFLVKNIVASWKGTIHVDSETDEGATFSIKIPTTTISVAEATRENFEINFFEKETHEVLNSDVVKILIVENQLEMINYLNHIFAIDYYCDFAYDGEQAYDLIQKNNYELIISDYKMPIMDGLELQSILKEKPKTANIPFILISASDIENQLDHLYKDDLFRFLRKPFTEHKLKLLIQTFIGIKSNVREVTSTHETTTILKNDTISIFLQKVNSYILENLENDRLKIDDIAQHMGYSQKQFTTILNRHTNLNPNKVVLEIRLLKAYEFIMNGHYKTIGEIMAAIGMNSRPYFYKVFEERFGIKVGEMHKKYTKSYLAKDDRS